MSSGFRLSKWYLDCVTEDGRAFLAYHAALVWRRLRFRYASILVSEPARETCRRQSLAPGSPPAFDEGVLRWRCPRLGVDASWDPLRSGVTRFLPGQWISMKWECLVPLAQAEVRLPGATWTGLGYAERMTLTGDRSTPPLDELRWGRFLAPNRSLVWIDWRGDFPFRLVLDEGLEVPASAVDDRSVVLAGGATLEMSESRVLRQGRALPEALSTIPGFAGLMQTTLPTEETKWLSRSRFRDSGVSIDTGWAIHEVVQFGTADR